MLTVQFIFTADRDSESTRIVKKNLEALLMVRLENVLDWKFEQPSHLERQGQAWIVLFRFDGVDGLARNFKLRGQIGLRPFPGRPQLAQPVFHR